MNKWLMMKNALILISNESRNMNLVSRLILYRMICIDNILILH